VAAVVVVDLVVVVEEMGLGFWPPLFDCNWIQLFSWKALNQNCLCRVFVTAEEEGAG